MERGRASALAEQKEKDEAASEIFEDLTKDTGSDHTRAFEEYCKTHDLDPLNRNNKVMFAEKTVPGGHIEDKWTFWNSESATGTLPENDNDVFGGNARLAPSRGAGSTVSSRRAPTVGGHDGAMVVYRPPSTTYRSTTKRSKKSRRTEPRRSE